MKKIKKFTLSFLLILSTLLTLLIPQLEATASVKSYITEKNFKGTFYAQGKYADEDLTLTINKISKNSISFTVDQYLLAQEVNTNTITSKIEGNTVKFTYKDNRCNKGKGILTFDNKKQITLSIQTTKLGEGSRFAFNYKNVIFKRKDVSTTIYMLHAGPITKFEKSNNKLIIQSSSEIKEASLSTVKNRSYCDYGDWFFDIENKNLSFKLSSKCKWRYCDLFDTFSDNGEKSSYKEIKDRIKDCKSEYDFAIFVFVKNKTVYKVVYVFS